MSNFNLIQGDCLEKMNEIPDGSVDAIICDPPYGTMDTDGGRRMKVNGWDKNINTDKMFFECNRVLRTNGAIVLFSQEPYTSHLINNTHANVPFSYRMTWLKDSFANHLGCKKAPVSYTEDVCVFFKNESDVKNPAWAYTNKIFEWIDKPKKQIFSDFENNGYPKYATLDTFNSEFARRYNFPTYETYNALVSIYKIDRMPGFLSYEYAKKISEDFRIMTPRVFNLQEGQKYKSNVLEYRKDYTGHHPTQKPVALMEDLVHTYSNAGDTVLDFTMGSGSTGVACKNIGRNFIGIEMDTGYFEIAKARIESSGNK